jgi:hypothetical protein
LSAFRQLLFWKIFEDFEEFDFGGLSLQPLVGVFLRRVKATALQTLTSISSKRYAKGR